MLCVLCVRKDLGEHVCDVQTFRWETRGLAEIAKDFTVSFPYSGWWLEDTV